MGFSATNAPPVSAALPRHAYVDVLRAVACLAVVAYHLSLYWLGAWHAGFAATAARASVVSRAFIVPSQLGFLGVSLFLVLSGFCLQMSVRPGAPLGVGRFFSRRAVRTLPAYYASIAIVSLLSLAPSLAHMTLRPVRARDVWSHVLMIHNLIPDTVWTINGVYWTLALEWQLYLVFPLAVVALRRLGARWFLLASLAVSLGWYGALRAHPTTAALTAEPYAIVYESVPGRWFEFASGMVAAELVRRGARMSRPLLSLVALAWIPAATWVHIVDVWAFPFDRAVCGASFGCLLCLAATLPSLSTSLVSRALAWIGGLSYSLYLVHQPLLVALSPLALARPIDAAVVGCVVVGVPLSVAVAWVFFMIFERPVLAFLRTR